MARLRTVWQRAAPYVVPAAVYLVFLLLLFWRLWTPIDGARRAFGWDAQWEYWGDLQFQVDALRDGELPLWNPFDRAGYPFHSDPQTGWLYPLNWPLVAAALVAGATPWWLIAIKVVAHFWIACIGAYAFLRRHGAPRPACYAAGFAFVLGYPHLHNAFSALNWNIAWAPWMLIAVDEWARRPTRATAVLVAFATGMAALAGGPAAFWYACLVAAPYGVWAVVRAARAADAPRAYWRRVGATAAVAAGLFAMLVAAQASATAELLGHSVRAARDLDFVTFSTFGVDDLAAFLIPRMLGGNTYLGYATILWAGIALAAFPSGRALVLAGVAVAGVLLAFGSNGPFLAAGASAVPAFGLFRRAHRYLYVTQLAVALLGAEGLAALLRCDDDRRRRRLRAAVLAAGGLGLAIFGVGAVVKWQPDLKAQPLRDAFALACAAVVTFTWITHRMLGDPSRRGLYATLAVVALVADLWFAHAGQLDKAMHPVPRPARDAVLSTLDGVPLSARIYDREWFKFRPGIRRRVRDFGGYEDDPLALRRYARLRDRLQREPRLLGHANVRYLSEAGRKRLRKSAADRAALRELQPGLYELSDWAPAVYWTGDVQVVDDEAAAVDALLASPPGTRAVVARGAAGAALLARASEARSARPAVAGRLVTLERNRVVAEVDAPDRGVVVIHEAYYPHHWRATVDGQPAPIVPVNGLFRGIVVEPGAHRIEMAYRAPGYVALAALVPLALVVGAALVWTDRRRRRA
ncbi:MAG: hypothetical protein D6689_07830 [Deltaproteobacteria bacterium]|nr:MAG: hypothetical protein D6689_07830 [Deltaproteobacteria bacterium]